ncbi:hypothetical protein FHS43_000709 [Streptosporangium becharense]|uniref:Uncharacterized protein n=1 Tax=Streptosporangium becharense TaxID=1816182 RepID=A0A7W9MG78_9ACTN|nr:hypothetical protein [Streptosporangium becharense]MBB2909463.1 hypothetical protein [Streptosporangium becharense]MBB5819580.1 hypothetical protein [Streptosporangium becharense]
MTWPEGGSGVAQPWAVPSDDSASYDWYAEPEDDLPLPPAGSPAGAAAPWEFAAPGRQGDARPAPDDWAGPSTPSEPVPFVWPTPPGPDDPPPGPEHPSGPPWRGASGTGSPWQGLDETTAPSWPVPSEQEGFPPPNDSPGQTTGSSQPASPGPADPPGPPWRDTPAAPIVPGAPPWQPPPAFTAAAAGMQVWPSPGDGTPWPAATGEPVWSGPEEPAGRPDDPGQARRPDAPGDAAHPDTPGEPARPGEPGDVAVWPPSAVSPDGSGESTARVHRSDPALPGTGEPAVPPVTVPGPHVSDQGPASGSGVHGAEAASITGSGVHRADTPPAAEPEQRPTPAAEPEPVSQAPVPPAVPPAEAAAHTTAPATAPASEAPAPPSDFLAEATPPGGIPAIPPPFPAASPPLAASPPPTATAPQAPAMPPAATLPPVASATSAEPPTASSASTVSTEPPMTRGPFTPLSEFTPDPPPPPAEPQPKKRASTMLIAAVVTVVVAGIGTGAFFAYRTFNAGQTTASAPSSAGSTDSADELDITSEPEPINTAMLNSERTDPGAMTVAAAFEKKVTVAGTTFTRVKTDVTEQCHRAAADAFAIALRGNDCRRVLRATYVDRKKQYAVTTGIAVLPTRESAITVDKEKNLDGNVWFRGLPAKAGSGADRVHIAGGYAAGMVWGRYIVFSYATFSDGRTPTEKEKDLGRISGAFRDQTAKAVERRVTS